MHRRGNGRLGAGQRGDPARRRGPIRPDLYGPPPFETPRGRGSSGSAGLGAMRVAGTTYYEWGAEGPGRRRAGTATRSASARKGKQSPVCASGQRTRKVDSSGDVTMLRDGAKLVAELSGGPAGAQ